MASPRTLLLLLVVLVSQLHGTPHASRLAQCCCSGHIAGKLIARSPADNRIVALAHNGIAVHLRVYADSAVLVVYIMSQISRVTCLEKEAKLVIRVPIYCRDNPRIHTLGHPNVQRSHPVCCIILCCVWPETPHSAIVARQESSAYKTLLERYVTETSATLDDGDLLSHYAPVAR